MKLLSSSSLVLSLFAISSDASSSPSSSSSSYSNEVCKSARVASTLNTLFNNEKGCNADQQPSFECSGMFLHGNDLSMGVGTDEPFSLTVSSYVTRNVSWSTNTTNNSSSNSMNMYRVDVDDVACPSSYTINSNGSYPPWCPTPSGLTRGAISFTYIRRDIMPKSGRLEDFDRNGTKQEKEGRAMYGWPGVGILFTGKQAPIQPQLLEKLQKHKHSTSSLWGDEDDEMRLLAAFPFDAATDSRLFCGLGLDTGMLAMGVDGPAMSPNELRAKVMQYDTVVGGWCPLVYNANNNMNKTRVTRSMLEEQYAKEFPGRHLYCNKDIQNYEDYFNYARQGLEQIKTKGYSPAFIEELNENNIPWKVGENNYTYCTYLYDGTNTSVCPGAMPHPYVVGDHHAPCPVAARRFDSVFIPSTRHVDAYLQQGEYDIGNEVMLTSWGGLEYKELAPYMAVYYDANDSQYRDQAVRIADMFYNATGIQIPVVHWSSAESARDLVNEKAFQCA